MTARARFSRRFSTARKSILVLVSQSKNHTPDYCDTKNRIIAILKLFPPKGGKIILSNAIPRARMRPKSPLFLLVTEF